MAKESAYMKFGKCAYEASLRKENRQVIAAVR